MTTRLLFPLIVSLLIAGGSATAHQPSPVPAQSRPSPISESELLKRLATSLDSLATVDQFSGVVVLAKGGTPVFQKAYGLADREARRANDLETAFNLGSINKAFTQTAILQLSVAGKLDLDSTLARYWPDYPNQEVARKVTIRQMMRHTSGIGGNIFAAPLRGRRNDIRKLQDYLPLFVNEPLEFQPGTRTAYSNAGYIVLGLLIERLSGESYYSYVSKHIFEPAGMTRTGSFAVDSLPPNTAFGYTRGGQAAPLDTPLRRNTSDLPGRGSSAGGGYSTAQDLLKFLKALREHRITSGLPAGLGVGGGAPGINAAVEGGLPGGYDLVVLANLDPPAAMRVGRMAREWLGVKEDGRRVGGHSVNSSPVSCTQSGAACPHPLPFVS